MKIFVKNPLPHECISLFRSLAREQGYSITDEAKDMIYEKFYESLKKKGVLFIGSTEQISNYKDIGFERLSSFYFQKPE